MIIVTLKNAENVEIPGCDHAEVEPDKCYPAMLLIKEHSYSSNTKASILLSEIIGYEQVPDPEPEEE